MSQALVWISGASSGIGKALADAVPWDNARVIDISRSGAAGLEHVEADLSDPASWPAVAQSFERELRDFSGDVAVFVHAAGTIEPIGYAGEVEGDAYASAVVLNSAAPQALGRAFLSAAADVDAVRHIVMLTSGAATSVYPGWSSYGAGKAAVDQWVRNAGAEQDERGGVRVISITPGTVDTAMQERIRETSERDFPKRSKFVDLHERGELADPDDVARQIWELLAQELDNGSVVDLRELASAAEE
ncbi:MAG: SDR family NAD(P)-dependent oxidoreductase [Actinomycetota bacterium]|nr:SDR family NAD(P)-dependent oxidoreductase [Actinomycetota bacterium]